MKKLLYIFFIISTVSCNSDDPIVIEDDYSFFTSTNSIATDVEFMPKEIYRNISVPHQSPVLSLKLVTRQEYECVNFIMVTTEYIVGNELIIRFDAIVQPAVCLTAIGPAISHIDLPEHIDKLVFINGNTIDKYSVEINPENVSISTIENNFTTSLHDNTFRYPENSFVYVCGTNTNSTHIYDDFLEILTQNPNFTEFEFIGEGRIPYPESSSGHWVNHPAKYFIYTDVDEFEGLESVLDDFSTQNIEESSGVGILLYSWDNVRYYSW